MASELRVNTLKDASGNNSVAMSNVAKGSAKAFINGGEDASIRNSLNISTNTDVSTGTYEYGFSNAFTTEVDAHCAIAGMAGGGNRSPRIASSNTTASVMRVIVYNTTPATADSEHYVQLLGDLA